MTGRYHLLAGTAILALLFASAAPGQEVVEGAGAESPLASLVLVLNVISDTHARPATGVVIRGETAGPAALTALVLVPADFVSAGDEIVVLDGGTDILRHGRSARTVARSARTGVALLEVEGLVRPGVAVSSNPWPPEGLAEFEFAAWPAAEALAKGAPMIRYSLQLEDGAFEPAAPGVSGPLFDRCGRLAALHLAEDDSRLVAGTAVAGYLASAGYDAVQAPCLDVPEAGAPAADSPKVPDPVPSTTAPAEQAGQAETDADSGEVDDEPLTLMRWAGAGGLLVLAAVVTFFALAARRRRPALRLAGVGTGNQGARLELRFTRGGTALLQRPGASLAFELKQGRILVSDPGGEAAARLALAVGGTPCLPGEVFIAEPGLELRIGAETWQLHFDSEGAP